MNGFTEIKTDKRKYMELLLLGDEQESMIDRYIDRGQMFALMDGDTVYAVCIVTDEGGGELEIKNIAVAPQYQRRGIGKRFIRYIEESFAGKFSRLTAGTGDSPLTVPFYESCGFVRYRVEKDFFIKNYDHPIIESGVQLCDMIYFEKLLKEE